MIGGSFYQKTSAAKVAQHKRAANDDVNQAADFLQRILTLDTPARDPVTKVASPLSVRMADQIESCISKLQSLKQRLQRHAYLLDLIQQAERDLKNTPCIFSDRSADVERQTIDVQSQLSRLLEEKEILMRKLLIVRKQLQVRRLVDFMLAFYAQLHYKLLTHLLTASPQLVKMHHCLKQDLEADSTSDDDSSPRDIPKSNTSVSTGYASIVASPNIQDKKVNIFPSSSPLSTRNRNNFETPVWDDSLDVD